MAVVGWIQQEIKLHQIKFNVKYHLSLIINEVVKRINNSIYPPVRVDKGCSESLQWFFCSSQLSQWSSMCFSRTLKLVQPLLILHIVTVTFQIYFTEDILTCHSRKILKDPSSSKVSLRPLDEPTHPLYTHCCDALVRVGQLTLITIFIGI